MEDDLRATSSVTLATAGMARFSCLGSACEDTCCQGWSITIDEPHYVDLRSRMAAVGDAARFDEAFEPIAAEVRTASAFATIQLRKTDAHCPLLSAENLCTVHHRFGDPALPDVCASYPRLGRLVDGRLEVHGAQSCPEVVRRGLVDEDGADLVEVSREAFGRVPIVDRADGAEAALLDEIRGGCAMLLDDPRYPIATRLFLIACFGDEVARGVAEAGDADDRLIAVGKAVELFSNDEVLQALDAERRRAAPTEEAAEIVLVQILRLRSIVRPAFEKDLDRVVAALSAEGTIVREAEGFMRGPGFAEACARRLGSLSPDLADALDGWLLRFARAFVLRDLKPDGAVLFARLRELCVRIATLRLLAASAPDPTFDEATLSAWFVRCVYQVARLADHSPVVTNALFDGLDRLLPAPEDLLGLLALVMPPR